MRQRLRENIKQHLPLDSDVDQSVVVRIHFGSSSSLARSRSCSYARLGDGGDDDHRWLCDPLGPVAAVRLQPQQRMCARNSSGRPLGRVVVVRLQPSFFSGGFRYHAGSSKPRAHVAAVRSHTASPQCVRVYSPPPPENVCSTFTLPSPEIPSAAFLSTLTLSLIDMRDSWPRRLPALEPQRLSATTCALIAEIRSTCKSKYPVEAFR